MSNERSGHALKGWTVGISIDEHEGQTRARARLRWRDQESVGVGLARLNPRDRNINDIGDELAAARALADLANRMIAVTEHDIEAATNKPVTAPLT